MAELNPSYTGANPADQFLLDTQKYDTDGVLILSSKRRQSKLETESPIPTETVNGGVWTFYEMEQISDKLVFLVTNTRDVANAPEVKSSKYDENLGQVKITKQLIATPNNTNSVLTPTSKTYYEARETGVGPSSVVCYKIVETYSTGVGVDPNPAFPTKTENTVSPELGNVPVVKVSQITTDTSSVGSLTYAGTIGTKITYTPFNQYLRLRVTETWNLFDRGSTKKEYPQVIPQKFLANAIVTESSSVYPAALPNSTTPNIVTGAIKIDSQRVDSSTVQDNITSRTLSLPVNVAGSLRTEHGIATVTDSLVTATQTADPSYLVLSDKVDGLNNGTQTREKVVIDSFPLLSGQLFDKQNDAAIRYTEQIQSAPPLGQTRTEIVPEDFSRSRVRVFDEASIDSAFSDVTTILGLTKVNLPPELISATVIYTGASGSSVSSSSDPVYNKYTPVGTSSNGSLSKTASLGGSIQVHTDLTYVIKDYSSTEVVCTHYFFYVKSGATMAQILSKCGGASQLPLFFPNPFQLVLSGMGVNYSLSANTQLQVGVSADGGSSDSATKTAGYSLSNEYITQVTSIPACIRPSTTISVIGSPILTTGLMVASANTPAISYGGSTNAPAVTNSVSTTATATATITPSVIPATSGTTAIPKSGNYLVELTGNVSEYGYNLMHGVVVNFSQYA